ncbi:hypothetical protein GCM10027579_12320 [Calidifontibacter terrae]
MLTIPGVVNVVNFMDGINGISSMTAIIWGLNAAQVSRCQDTAVLGALLAGAGLGFLPWNSPDARLFLGDAGSYLMGGAMAAGILCSLEHEGFIQAALVGAPLTLYVADVAQAIAHRRRAGAELTAAHRDHIYQQLVDDACLPHLTVASLHTVGASLIVAAWRTLRPAGATVATLAVCTAYMALPRLTAPRSTASHLVHNG